MADRCAHVLFKYQVSANKDEYEFHFFNLIYLFNLFNLFNNNLLLFGISHFPRHKQFIS